MNLKSLILSALVLSVSVNQVSAAETLKSATKGKFLMGVAINMNQVNGNNPVQSEIIKEQFQAIVAENCMKPQPMQPVEGQFKYDDADKFVAFGEKNKQVVTGHCLMWHSQIPRWFFVDSEGKNVSPEVLKERMRTHILTVVGRYKGRVKGYDVVNEAFEDNGSYRNSKFYQILGKDFIKYAFQFAHEADPNAELYYNDYNMYMAKKCDAVVEMVKELKAAGCRVDAVGMQGHMGMEEPTVNDFEASILKIKSAGVKVMVTEWDISILPNPFNHQGANISDMFKYSKELDPYRDSIPADVQLKWNKRVLDMFELFLKHKDVMDRVTIWGLNDGESWKNNFPMRGRKDYPLLFDRNNNPKPVVKQMIELAKKY